MPNYVDYNGLGKVIRKSIIDIVDKAGRGHIGSAFSLVEILNVLYESVLNYRPHDPEWDDRDRFILSKGHGCLALYPILAKKGFFPKTELYKFCAFDGILGGHPEHEKIPGVEASTGALGHGFSIGMGMALRAKIDKKNFRVFVAIGDGESNEGSTWEAALSASKHNLGNLIVIIDYNKYQSYGPVSEVLNLEPYSDKWKAFGFNVYEADMNDPLILEDILQNKINYKCNKPHAVICHTIKGKGISFVENNLEWHHKARLRPEEVQRLKEAIDKEQ
ncbi:transketolase [Bacteriovoracales bacterium]|nr:transketolase [Bacteriovoracales bacterium]